MRTIRSLRMILAVCFVLTMVANQAVADEPVVAKQLYDLEGRFEIMLTPTMSAHSRM